MDKNNVIANLSIHNKFDIEVYDADTNELKQSGVAYNVICDNLWNVLLTPASYFNYLQYGSGTGTPASSDTSLFTYVGYISPVSGGDSSSLNRGTGVYYYKRTFRIEPETAVGVTLTEVGVSSGTSSSNLVTHAMIKDADGNPLTIAKTASDIVIIYATIYVHYPPGGWDNGHILIAGDRFLSYLAGLYYVDEDGYAVRSAPLFAVRSVNGGYGYRGAYDMYSSSSDGYANTGISAAYDKSNKRITLTCSRVSASVGNISGGIRSFYLGYKSYRFMYGTYVNECYASIIIRPGGTSIPPAQITGEYIGTGDGTTTDFATDFPFISNATIYVDNIVETGITIDTNEPNANVNNMLREFNCISEPGVLSWNKALSNGTWDTSTGTFTYENPYYSTIGIASVQSTSNANGTVQCSDDFSTWTTVATLSDGGAHSIASEYQNYRYWRITKTKNNSGFIFTANSITANNIHFDIAPAEGTIITANYTTSVLPKTSDYVFDMTVTIQLGEYVESSDDDDTNDGDDSDNSGDAADE